jgi:hypothetical protein
MTTKPLYQSRTVWVQLLAIASALFPPVADWIAGNPESFVGVFAALNVLIRFITSGKVEVFGKSGGAALAAVVGFGFLAFAASSLTSCHGLAGSVHYLDSKTGLETGAHLSPGGEFQPYVRQDFRDASGNLIGSVDLHSK